MKHLTLLLFFFTTICFSQKITSANFEEKFNTLLENLGEENWEEAEKLSSKLLDFTRPTDTMDMEKKVLRYMYIYSTAGLLNEKKISKEEALKKTKHLKGFQMTMPAHPFNSKCYVNCTHFTEDEKDTFFSDVNNSKGTQIFAFEYVKIKDGIKETQEELEGEFIVLSGRLDEIAVEGNMLPRFKLRFIDGEYEILKD